MGIINDTLDAPNSSYRNAAAITKDDDVDLANPTKEIYVGGAGSLHVLTVGGQNVTFAAVPVGTIVRVQAVRVYEDSVASNLVAMW